mmetsp:Transcript_2750/g.8284  ORF Transcript_2750/g.8284 Transcript_2750/m.8284 type:complete len:230 (-) Transcript_2750:131-820(-)
MSFATRKPCGGRLTGGPLQSRRRRWRGGWCRRRRREARSTMGGGGSGRPGTRRTTPASTPTARRGGTTCAATARSCSRLTSASTRGPSRSTSGSTRPTRRRYSLSPSMRARTAPGLRAIGQRRGPQASRPQAALQHRQPAAPALRLLRHILLREGLAGRGVDAESASRSSILSTAWAPALVCARRRRVTMEFIIPCAWSDAHAGRAVSAAAGPALGGGGALPPYTPQYE